MLTLSAAKVAPQIIPLLGPHTGSCEVDSHGGFLRTISDGYFSCKLNRRMLYLNSEHTYTVVNNLCGTQRTVGVDYSKEAVDDVMGAEEEVFDFQYGYRGKIRQRDKRTGKLPENTFVRIRKRGRSGKATSLRHSYDGDTVHKGPDNRAKRDDFLMYDRNLGGVRYTQVLLGPLDLYSRHIESDIFDMERYCVEKAVNKLKVADLGETLVELSEMIFAFRGIIKHAAHGKLLKDISKHVNPFNLGSKSGLLNALNGMMSSYLVWVWAIRPLVTAFDDIVKNYALLNTDSRRTYVVRAQNDRPNLLKRKLEWKQTDLTGGVIETKTSPGGHSYSCYYQPPEISGGGCQVTFISGISGESDIVDAKPGPTVSTSNTTFSASCQMEIELVASPIFALKQLGLNAPAVTLYQVLPFSFLLERLVKIEDSLKVLNYDDGYEIMSIKETLKFTSITLTEFGGVYQEEAFMRFRRDNTYVPTKLPEHYNFKKGVITVYSGTPWSNPDPYNVPVERQVTIGEGLPEFNEMSLSFAVLLGVLTSALIALREQSDILLTKREKSRYRKLFALLG